MGLGLLGRGVSDVAFLAECGSELTVTDLKTKDELKGSLKELKKYKDIHYVLGGHHLEHFRDQDMILKVAGTPLDSIYIAEAEKNDVPVEMSASLVTQFSPALIVGVTGTRGKSTVTHLIHHILKKAKKDVHLGGNVRGIGTLELLRKALEGDIIVMELDSWQLQGFGKARVSPDIAVFTTFLPDHMDYYQGSMEDYWKDKVNIFTHQTSKQHLIVGMNMEEKARREILESSVTVASSETLPKDWKLQIPGSHNRDNAALAVEVARLLNIDETLIKKAVENFKGVEGRLQFVKEVGGVKIYNDNNATSPAATVAGLRALNNPPAGGIILIVGGTDKGLDIDDLLQEIPKHCKTVILFEGTGTDKMKKYIKELPGTDVYEEDDLTRCVKRAMKIAKKGDTLLYSPAFASFGSHFKNEYDRNDQFLSIVKKL